MSLVSRDMLFIILLSYFNFLLTNYFYHKQNVVESKQTNL